MIDVKKTDFVIILLTFLLLILSFFIIQSFIIPLIFTLLLVYILNPVYKKVKKIFKSHTITSLLIIISFILIFISPMIYSIITLSGDFSSINTNNLNDKINLLNDKINNKYNLNLDLKSQFDKSVKKFNIFIDSMLLKIPEFLFNLFIVIFFYYYFSRDYNHEIRYIKNILKSKKMCYIEEKLKKLIEGVIYGQILVRFIQALVGTIGFLIIGVDNSFLWGVLLFFVGFLPIIGTGLIWGPLAILNILKADYFLGISIIIIGLIISSIDNLLLPYLISEKINIGPVLTLISIIGGIELFGFYGIILGPFFLGLFVVLFDEILFEIRKSNDDYKKYLWTTKERKNYRELKTENSKIKFIEKLNEKYGEKLT